MTAVQNDLASNRSTPDQETTRPALEGEIRDLVRRNITKFPRPDATLRETLATHPVNDAIHRVSESSIAEIERVIHELNGVRDMLRGEGDRVTREVAGYASLNHAAMTSMRIIADSLAQWKNGAPVHNGRG